MKVKCVMCENELGNKCMIKKTTINPRKDRKCEFFEYSQARELDILRRRARVMDTQEKAHKSKHPITGDLSRFKTTAAK